MTDRITALENITDPDFIWGALDNVHDAETTLDDYAAAVSRAQREALATSQPARPVAWGESYDGGKSFDTVSLNKTRHHTFPLYSAPQPLTVQDAARVPEIAALIEAAKAVKPHIGGALGFTLNAALRAIAEGRA